MVVVNGLDNIIKFGAKFRAQVNLIDGFDLLNPV